MTNNKQNTPPLHLQGNSRIKWVDTAKALGIFLVFWGHLLSGGSPIAIVIKKVIYSFHMPMYFILSGYVFKNNTSSFGAYIDSKIKRILLPALFLYLLSLPIYFMMGIDYSKESVGSILEPVFFLYGRCAYNSPVWFFICIFEVLLVVRLLRIKTDDSKKLMLVIVSSLILSYVFYLLDWKYFKLFGLDKCVLGLFFFSIGIFLNRCLYEKDLLKVALASLPIWIILGIIVQPQVFMYGMELGNFWLYIVSAISGSLVFFALCSRVASYETIREYSRWIIFIICSHYVLVTLFKSFSSKIGFLGTYTYDILSVLYVISMLLLYRPICRLIEAKIPLLMGK